MNKYDKVITFILLKVCRIFSKYSSIKNCDTLLFTIEQNIKDIDKDE